MTITLWNPSAAATMPMPMPVLPAVPSTITPPGRNAPRAIASRTMASAARSLTEPPGFMNSALPRMAQPVAAEAARSLISGVLPMDSITVGLKRMFSSSWRAVTLGEAGGPNKPRRHALFVLTATLWPLFIGFLAPPRSTDVK